MFATLSKINDWFETFRHAEGSMDFLWTFKAARTAARRTTRRRRRRRASSGS